MSTTSLSADIVFALTKAPLVHEAVKNMSRGGVTIGMIIEQDPGQLSKQQHEAFLVFHRITQAATEGNKAALSCLSFYLDEAKRLNAAF